MATETESLILKIDNTQAISAAEAFTIACLKAEQALVLSDRQVRAAEQGFNRLAAGQDRSNKISAITARQIESLRKETASHTQSLADNIAKVEQAVRSQTTHTDALRRAVVETRAMAAANREAGASADQSSGKMAGMTGSVRGFVQTIASLAGGLSAAVAIRGLISNSAALETAMVGVQKTTNLTDDEMAKFRGRIDQVASRTPVATASLLDIAQAAGQLGVRGVDSLAKFTETIAKLQSATDIQGGDGAKKLARLIGINGEDVGQAIEGVGAAITRLGNESRASESEILGNAETVAQATAQYRIGSLNALALGAAMKSLGTDAEVGGTAVGRTMDAIDKAVRKPGPELEVLKKLTGQTGQEIADLFKSDPTAEFARFVSGLNAAGKAGEDVKGILASLSLEDIRIARVLPVLGANYEELAVAIQKSREEGEKKQALDKEMARAQETLGVKAREAANVVGNLAERGFRPVNSMLKSFLDVVRDVNAESPVLAAGISSVTSALIALAAARTVAYIAEMIQKIGGLMAALNALRLALVSNPLTILAVAAAAVVGVMVSLKKATNEATDAMRFQREEEARYAKAAESFAPIASALADAEAKKKSAQLLKDPALELASLEQRISAARAALTALNAENSPLLGKGGKTIEPENVLDLIRTPEGRRAFEAKVNTPPTGSTMLSNFKFEDFIKNPTRNNVTVENFVPALIAEIQALEALKQKMQETGQSRQGTGADIEAQKAKLQTLLDTMRLEGQQVGQDNQTRSIAAQRRALEAEMTDAQRVALAPLLDQLGEQALLNAQAAKSAEDAARANEAHAKSIEEIVNAGSKAQDTLQGLIDKTTLEIQMLNMSTDERALAIAKIEAERLAAQSGNLAAYDLAATYVAQVEYLQRLTREKQDYVDVTKAAEEADRQAALAQLEAIQNVNQYLDSLERAVEMAGLDADAAERQEAAQTALNLAIAAGYDEQQTAKLKRVADAYTSVAQKTREARDFANDLGQDAAGVLGRLTDYTLSWEGAMQAANDTAKNLLQTFLQYAAIQPIAKGLANAFMPFATAIVGGAAAPVVGAGAGADPTAGVPSSALFNAYGNMIFGGSLVPFARGGLDQGVYTSAAIFPLNNGRVGVVGEGGRDELVAKPVRLPNGDMGVRAFGGGGTTTNHNITFGNVVINVPESASKNPMNYSARQLGDRLRRSI